MIYLAVFLAYVVLDYVWAEYVAAIGAHRALSASLWSSAAVALGSVGIISLQHDPLTVIPAALGAFVGTLIATAKTRKDAGNEHEQ